MQTLEPFWYLETFQLTLFLSLFIASLLLRMAMQTLQPSWDLETFQWTVSRGGRGVEISRAKTRETINYFIVKFITINEKVLIKPNFAGINFKGISGHF